MTFKHLVILGLMIMLSGCGRSYLLPGHREANLNHPPDVTLQQGVRVKAISTGFYFHPTLVPAFMESSDPEVVAIEVPPENNSGDAYLIAKQPGTATVRYGWVSDYDASNEGFIVNVVPK